MVNANNVTGSPVGVTIADNIKMNINSSGLLVVKKWIFNKFLFKRNNVINGSWNVIANRKVSRIMNFLLVG